MVLSPCHLPSLSLCTLSAVGCGTDPIGCGYPPRLTKEGHTCDTGDQGPESQRTRFHFVCFWIFEL